MLNKYSKFSQTDLIAKWLSIIQCKLDILISNTLQEFVTVAEINTNSYYNGSFSFSTYHFQSKFGKPSKNTPENLDEDDNVSKYNNIDNELGAIYNHIAEGMQIRNKCDWYGFFFSLQKQGGAQNIIKILMLMKRKWQTEQMV